MIDRRLIARERLLVGVLRDLSTQNRWLKARLVELHVRVKALDGVTPDPPPWPAIIVPPELRGLLTED